MGIISGSSILQQCYALSRTGNLTRSPHCHWATPSPGNPAASEPSAYYVASKALATVQQLPNGGNPLVVTRTSFFWDNILHPNWQFGWLISIFSCQRTLETENPITYSLIQVAIINYKLHFILRRRSFVPDIRLAMLSKHRSFAPGAPLMRMVYYNCTGIMWNLKIITDLNCNYSVHRKKKLIMTFIIMFT